jgi:hypothetical protein
MGYGAGMASPLAEPAGNGAGDATGAHGAGMRSTTGDPAGRRAAVSAFVSHDCLPFRFGLVHAEIKKETHKGIIDIHSIQSCCQLKVIKIS